MDAFNVNKITNGYILTIPGNFNAKTREISLYFPSLQEVYGHLKNVDVELEKHLWEACSHRITELQKRIERLEKTKEQIRDKDIQTVNES